MTATTFRFYWTLLFLSFCSFLTAQPVTFHTAPGLAQVNDADMSRRDVIWAATDDGVTRLNLSGSHTHFLRGFPQPLKVKCIDAEGNLAAAGGYGFLAIFDGSTWQYYDEVNSNFPAATNVSEVVVRQTNEVYFLANNAFYRWDGSSFSSIVSGPILSFAHDASDGSIYLRKGGLNTTIMRFQSGQIDTLVSPGNPPATKHRQVLDLDADAGILWAGTRDGLLQYDKVNRNWTEYLGDQESKQILALGSSCYIIQKNLIQRVQTPSSIDTLPLPLHTLRSDGQYLGTRPLLLTRAGNKLLVSDRQSVNIVYPNIWSLDYRAKLQNSHGLNAEFGSSGEFFSTLEGHFGLKLGNKPLSERAAIWYTASRNGQRLVNSPIWRVDYYQTFSGPKATAYDSAYLARYDRVWKVTKAQIDLHKQYYNNQLYRAPEGIALWPGNGNTANGESAILAPFEDDNTNGIYEPELGEVPKIRGHQAVYMMFNDFRALKTDIRGTPEGGMEFHCMAYVYDTADVALSNSIFLSIKAKNQSGNQLSDLRFGLYTNLLIGAHNATPDDAFGSDSINGLTYVYNSDNFDPGPLGFGSNPPALGYKFLSDTADGSGYAIGIGTYQSISAMFTPQSSAEAIQMMDGKWRDGNPLVVENPCGFNCLSSGDGYTSNGFGQRTRWAFNDVINWYNNPDPVNGLAPWIDQLMYLKSAPLDNGAEKCIDLVFTLGFQPNSSSPLGPINAMKQNVASVEQFYHAQNFGCLSEGISIEEAQSLKELKVYPNPTFSGGVLNIASTGEYKAVKMISMNGQVVFEQNWNHSRGDIRLQLPEIEPGLYLVQMQAVDGALEVMKIVVQ